MYVIISDVDHLYVEEKKNYILWDSFSDMVPLSLVFICRRQISSFTLCSLQFNTETPNMHL